MAINTVNVSERLRKQALNIPDQKILIARIATSEQEKDLTIPANCDGYGRVRHFKIQRYDDWSSNPLPIVPASKALGKAPGTMIKAQVFQNAACNWRCWYCYVDYNRLSADTNFAAYFSSEELVSMYLREADRPEVIDLSGGQPDITPEWIPWIMRELRRQNLQDSVFLWSDDNLSTDYFWRYLSEEDRQLVSSYPMYSRVCCFKGFDDQSFAFNTAAEPDGFDRQFKIFSGLLKEGIDLYAYVTFTSPITENLEEKMAVFVDKLQAIHPNLPLRTVPLKVDTFSPIQNRMKDVHHQSIVFQHDVHGAWLKEISQRFSPEQQALPITEVRIS